MGAGQGEAVRPPPGAGRRRQDAIALAAVLGVLALGALALRGAEPLSDERHHLAAIERLRGGDFRRVSAITTFPTYHALVAGLAAGLGVSGVDGIRLISTGLSLGLAIAVLLLARELRSAHARLRALQVLFLPVLFPFLFLVYTDVAALLCVCGALLACLRGRLLAAGLIASAGVAFRQDQVVWLGLVWLLCILQRGEAVRDLRSALRALGATWTFGLGALGLAGFVAWNGGVALGDRAMHPGGLHLGNHYFLLFAFYVCMLPLCVHRSPDAMLLPRVHPWRSAALVAAPIYLAAVFEPDHPYNQLTYGWFVHNRLVQDFAATWGSRLLSLAVSAVAVFTLAVTPLRRPAFLLLYPASALFLLPFWMIEPRYSMAPLALFLLLREDGPRWLELTLTAWLALLAGLLFRGVVAGAFFP